MIRYNTRDLIKRAQQLADLENSDFISWNENIMALNEAFQTLYQKAINKDDKYYLKECIIDAPVIRGNRQCYTLPNDFYQLYAINRVRDNTCLVRNSVNEPISNIGYDIINNELVITGALNDSVIVKYYPVAPALTYANDTVDISIPASLNNAQYYDVYDRYIGYRDTETREYHTFNWETGEDIKINELDGQQAALICAKNGVVATYSGEDNISKHFLFEYGVDRVGQPLGQFIGLDSDKNVISYFQEVTTTGEPIRGMIETPMSNRFPIALGPNVFSIFKELLKIDAKSTTSKLALDGDLLYIYFGIHKYIPSTESVEITIKYYACNIKEDSIIYESSDVFTDPLEAEAKYKEIFYTYLFKKDGVTYSLSEPLSSPGSGKYVRIENGEDVTDYGNAIGIMKVDAFTGYGVMTKAGNKFLIQSIFKDTELDYPNNFYMNMLAYQLALNYKTKQGGDTNGLMLLYSQAEDQFYNSITRDVYGVTRIQNVY